MIDAILDQPKLNGKNAEMATNKPADDVRILSLSIIDPSTQNPRRNWDEADLERLADSIADEGTGLLQPIVVRPRGKGRFEIVAGERRWRAAQKAGRKTIVATVRKLDDRQAAEARCVENAQRIDLNPIEFALGLRMLEELGHTAKSLAFLIGAEERVIASRMALLSLPDEWQSHVRRGALPIDKAEYLLPWVDRPQVLAAMLRHVSEPLPLAAKNHRVMQATEMPLSEWKHQIHQAVMTLSRSMDPKAPDGPRFELSESALRRLDVISIELEAGKALRRAMNVALWDEAQDRFDDGETELEAKDDAPAANESTNGKHGKRGPNGKSHSRKPSPASQAPVPAGRFGEPVLLDAAAAEATFRGKVTDWSAAYLRRLLREAIEKRPDVDLAGLAELLGVDPVAGWKLRRDFLELFTGGRLEPLAEELGIDVSACETDGERIAVLASANAQMPPAVFRDVLGLASVGL